MAASFSTLVVSWKEAAEMKLLVCRAALVIPWRTCEEVAGTASLASTSLQVLPLQDGIVIPQLTGSNNLTGFVIRSITWLQPQPSFHKSSHSRS